MGTNGKFFLINAHGVLRRMGTVTEIPGSIGSEVLLGTETLQSCLPHQLDNGGPLVHLLTSLVLPPDSEVVAPVSIRSPSGVQPGRCSLIESYIALTETYGVLVGHTLVDLSEWSASVLFVNPGSDVVYCPLSRVSAI